MMNKSDKKNLNVILAAGMSLIFFGFIFLLLIAGTVPDVTSMILPGLFFVTGLINFYAYLAFKKSAFRLFLALTLSLYGIFSALIEYSVITVPLDKIWPVYVLVASITLVIAGRCTGKRFAVSYDFSAIVLFVLGIIFLLFSFEIIKKPLNELAFIILPFILILSGIFLVILFLQRKSILEILPEDISDELNDDKELDDSE